MYDIDFVELFKSTLCWDCWYSKIYCDVCPHQLGYEMFVLSIQMLTGSDYPFI